MTADRAPAGATATDAVQPNPPATDWASLAERGSLRALRFGVWLTGKIGRRAMYAVLWPVSAYFFLTNGPARRGSRQYLERLWSSTEGRIALGRAPNRRSVLRHLHTFAISLYDRMLVFGGALDAFELQHDGSEQAFELARDGRGALLLGAHLGSFELLWLLSREYDLPVNVVAFHQNSQYIDAVLKSLDPNARVGVISIDPNSVQAAFELKACIDRGEFVVILADRVGPFEARSAEAAFLGQTASFPLAPFRLAVALGCPVGIALCLRIADSHYQTVFRPLRAAGRVPRSERDKATRELLEKYVASLEAYCQALPYEWFNFYEFWAERE